jgi:carbon-monoxide dehydrogenase small subunit
MTAINLTVNGAEIRADVAARTHLADFLRESLCLTGTHLGCEHGVCGACTLLIDGEPARSCITFTPACAGRAIQTIEGLEDDLVITALRQAFSAHHALQCGYCTPGMLMTARDIVRRLPDADDARIRLELAGNLCRCTGYNGIVAAIRDVLDQRLNFVVAPAAGLSQTVPPNFIVAPTQQAVQQAVAARPSGPGLSQTLTLAVPCETLWQALQDPALVASCVPGARITNLAQNHVTGEMIVAFGPIKGQFIGSADVTYGDHAGSIVGEGQDSVSKTRLTARADFNVTAIDAAASRLSLTIHYSLRGALAQFARGPIVAAFADEIAAIVGANLQTRLTGGSLAPPRAFNPMRVIITIIWRRAKTLLKGRP